MLVDCDYCSGTGISDSCQECGGNGYIEDDESESGISVCPECDGDNECYGCDGTGYVEEDE